MAFCATSFQSKRVIAYISGAIPTTQAPVTHRSRLEALTRRGIAMVRPIDYGLFAGKRILGFLSILATAVTVFFEAYACLTKSSHIKGFDKLPDEWQNLSIALLFSIGLLGLYSGLLLLLHISSITFFDEGLLLPSHCLHRGFLGRLAHFFIPAAFAGVEAISYSEIAYADFVVIRQTISSQDETSGKKTLWGFEFQHTHKSGSEKDVFQRTLVIMLIDGRIYEIQERRCQGYNAFELVVGMLQQKGIPIAHKRNY